MAFTEISLAITPLLETTFIGDTKLIVNANNTLFESAIEDLMNGLEIDLTNKYIGVDTPINNVFTEDVTVANSIIFKAGEALAAATIASLTQSSGVSTFSVDKIVADVSTISTAAGSLMAAPTMVIGTDGSNLTVTYPTTLSVADKGLYVGDSTTPIKTRLYGEVEIPKQAITQSISNVAATFTPRQISLTANGVLYTYAKLVLAKTDPQFLYIDLIFPNGYSIYGNPIWLSLYEDATNRPAAGQTFTVILNKIYEYNMDEVDYAVDLPPISNVYTDEGINIICGVDAATSTYKRININSSAWTSVPASDILAIAAAGTDDAYYVRFGNENSVEVAVHAPKNSSFSFTKTEQATDYSNYTITNSQNTIILNTSL